MTTEATQDAPTDAQPRPAVAGQVERSVRPSPADALLRTMDRAGWALDWVDMDLTGAAPKLEIRASRYDGLWLRAYVDELGRATVERFHRERHLGMRGNEKGRRPLVQLVDDHFIGRQRYEGGRALMRGLCAYLTDNALHPIGLADMRSAWAALMNAPARIAGPNPQVQRPRSGPLQRLVRPGGRCPGPDRTHEADRNAVGALKPSRPKACGEQR